jgi:hypothetical protein
MARYLVSPQPSGKPSQFFSPLLKKSLCHPPECLHPAKHGGAGNARQRRHTFEWMALDKLRQATQFRRQLADKFAHVLPGRQTVDWALVIAAGQIEVILF